jgi:alpha-galactosidase
MMGGSFGFELDPKHLSEDERAMIPGLIRVAEEINPLVIEGDMYRLAAPENNRPAVLYLSSDGARGVVLAYQIRAMLRVDTGAIRLQGLEKGAVYRIEGREWDGETLMNAGLELRWQPRDYQSMVLQLYRVN